VDQILGMIDCWSGDKQLDFEDPDDREGPRANFRPTLLIPFDVKLSNAL